MRRTLIVLVLAFSALTFAATASAQSAHFVGQPRCVDVGTTVQCSGKIAGLGSGPVTLVIEAEGLATVECRNPGGNVAPGQTTETTSAGTFDLGQPRGGNITFRNVETAEPPAPDPAAVCPNRQWTAEITDVQFTDATLIVFQGGVEVLRQTVTVT